MKRTISWIMAICLSLLTSLLIYGQEVESGNGYQFQVIKKLPATSPKNQYKSSTCWSFSVISMLESELLRMGKGEFDLSEMYAVRRTYEEKATKYVRMHGTINFAGGGFGHDVLHVIKTYGMVPEEIYSGLIIGEENHIHNEMDEVLKGCVDDIVKNKNRQLTPVWDAGFNKLLDTYLGEVPVNFTYKGQSYSPESFARSLGLDPDKYIEVSSFTHHPFYKKFALEVPDNWSWGEVYNVPLDEMMEIIYNSIEKGYTVTLSADISERGFSWTNGVAVVPDMELEDQTGTEREKWEALTDSEKEKMMYAFTGPVPEKSVTQEMRQEGFDNYTTTDDHGMHITGLAKDKDGNKYFLVKNSWGPTGSPYDGYLYASDAFVRYKTIAIMVNKETLSPSLLKKLGLN